METGNLIGDFTGFQAIISSCMTPMSIIFCSGMAVLKELCQMLWFCDGLPMRTVQGRRWLEGIRHR